MIKAIIGLYFNLYFLLGNLEDKEYGLAALNITAVIALILYLNNEIKKDDK